jgi:hypothetical protein
LGETDPAKGLPLVVANTQYINDENWKFLGIAFTGCTIDEASQFKFPVRIKSDGITQALRLAMAPPKTSHGNRVAVIVGGSCTVSAPHDTQLRVTNAIKFSTTFNLTLNAEGIPPSYRQAYPVAWTYSDQMDNRRGPVVENPDLVVYEGETVFHYTETANPIFLAGVVLDTGKIAAILLMRHSNWLQAQPEMYGFYSSNRCLRAHYFRAVFLPHLVSRTCVRHFIKVSIELQSDLRLSSSTSPVDGRTTLF